MPRLNLTYDLHPFGETFMEEHNSTDEYSHYKFNGKELDEETGLYYYGARYYDPQISIWYGVDQMADKYPSTSPFMYTLGNPVILVDPDGNSATVFITGDDESANNDAKEQLNSSTSLNITRNPKNGKISATGEAKTDDDKLLLVSSPKISLQIKQ